MINLYSKKILLSISIFVILSLGCDNISAQENSVSDNEFTVDLDSQIDSENIGSGTVIVSEKAYPDIRPVIYFHGGAGSAAQFETQAMRFASNGYPQNYLAAFEYSTAKAVPDKEEMNEKLDTFIDAILLKTGADKVDIMGKTWPGAYPDGIPGLTMEYMSSSPNRAAKIAHAYYADSALSGYEAIVPTLASWADIGAWDDQSEIIGAQNIILKNHTHVQTCMSEESFRAAYRFFNGTDPETSKIIPESKNSLELMGKAINFQENTPVTNGKIEIYEVKSQDGQRFHPNPNYVYILGGDGAWGPFKGVPGQHYEFVIVRKNICHHFYYEPFIRSDHFIRLITQTPGYWLKVLMCARKGQSNMNVLRNMEFLGDQKLDNDILKINGVNIISKTTCPTDKKAISIFIYDLFADSLSELPPKGVPRI